MGGISVILIVFHFLFTSVIPSSKKLDSSFLILVILPEKSLKYGIKEVFFPSNAFCISEYLRGKMCVLYPIAIPTVVVNNAIGNLTLRGFKVSSNFFVFKNLHSLIIS